MTKTALLLIDIQNDYFPSFPTAKMALPRMDEAAQNAGKLLAQALLARRETLQLVLNLDWRQAQRILPWRFLLALGTGIALAVLSLARFLEWALEAHPVRVCRRVAAHRPRGRPSV